MTAVEQSHTGQRGGPLLMLMMLIVGWVAVRFLWWDDPFAPPDAALASPPSAYANAPQSQADPYLMAAAQPVYPAPAYYGPGYYGPDAAGGALPPEILRLLRQRQPQVIVYRPRYAPPAYAYAPEPDLGLPSYPSLPPGAALPPQVAAAAAATEAARAPYLAEPRPAPSAKPPGRWSLDSWAFYRQGSDETVRISQGRQPIYGASQAGAVLQYRLTRSSGLDPRLYLRAYQANVPGGESEMAFGASLRPLARVPLRLAGEARYTTNPFGSEVRPAAYAVTELRPMRLPLGTRLDAYGQAGWVGGTYATPFADGQATITRPLPFVGRLSHDALRMSFGAGVWGGVQRDASRLDIGPTLRLDLKIGKVPTRVSVDYRQRAAGDAVPASGVAATVSAGF